jgi:hypothetical protein
MYETEVQRTIKDLWKLKLKNNIMFFFEISSCHLMVSFWFNDV